MPKTDDERKAANREKQRRYRERQRQLKSAAAAETSNAGDAPTTMRDAVTRSLEAAKWITDSDGASVAQAKLLAHQVDELTHAGEVTRALSAHRALTTVLDDLGLNPHVRLQHELRSRRVDKPEVPDADNGEATKQGNVSKFERPKKRNAT